MKSVKYKFKNTFENFLSLAGYYGVIVTLEGFISYEKEISVESMLEYLEILFGYAEDYEVIYRWEYVVNSAFLNSFPVYSYILNKFDEKGNQNSKLNYQVLSI